MTWESNIKERGECGSDVVLGKVSIHQHLIPETKNSLKRNFNLFKHHWRMPPVHQTLSSSTLWLIFIGHKIFSSQDSPSTPDWVLKAQSKVPSTLITHRRYGIVENVKSNASQLRQSLFRLLMAAYGGANVLSSRECNCDKCVYW